MKKVAKTLKKYQFSAKNAEKAPHFLILGAIHGDEKCGTAALAKLITELEAGILSLKKGLVTIMPICNPLGYSANKRNIEKDLNRIIGSVESPSCDEEHFALEVQNAILEADYILDIHSMKSGDQAFVFQDYSDDVTKAMAAASGLDYSVEDWPAMLARSGVDDLQDTPLFCHRSGKASILIEAGQNEDPRAADISYKVVRRLLAHFEMIDGLKDDMLSMPKRFEAYQVVRKAKVGEMVKPWQNFDPVEKGALVARYEDGEEIFSPVDGVIMMPSHICSIGKEWFYFCKEKKTQ